MRSSGDFTFRDGERLIRFGAGALADARRADRGPGPRPATRCSPPSAPWATRRPASRRAPRPSSTSRAGPVPEAAAAVRGRVGERPLVAFGGGRVVDAAKAIAAPTGCTVGAIPTTPGRLVLHALPPHARRGRGLRLRPVRCWRCAIPALMASAPMPGLAATAMNALAHAVEALYAPGAKPGDRGRGPSRRRADGRRAFATPSPSGGLLAEAAVLGRLRRRHRRPRRAPRGLPDDRAHRGHAARGHQRGDAPALGGLHGRPRARARSRRWRERSSARDAAAAIAAPERPSRRDLPGRARPRRRRASTRWRRPRCTIPGWRRRRAG